MAEEIMAEEKFYIETLNCPGFNNLPFLLQKVVEEAIINCFFDNAPTDIDTVDDDYYYEIMREHFYNEDGDLHFCWYEDTDFFNYYKNQGLTLGGIDHQIQTIIKDVLSLNDLKVNTMYSQLTLKEIKLVACINDLLVISIKGTAA